LNARATHIYLASMEEQTLLCMMYIRLNASYVDYAVVCLQEHEGSQRYQRYPISSMSNHHIFSNCTDSQRYGLGALGRVGSYWYPLMLLRHHVSNEGLHGWYVKWWRGNEYSEGSQPPSFVPLADLDDACYGSVV
jgi:hypothetical protein